jgi:fibro-slime domain-containing protein
VSLIPPAAAEPPNQPATYWGTVLNFRLDHPDFGLGADGRISGNVSPALAARPQWSGDGRRVLDEWTDLAGKHLAPHLYGTESPCVPMLDTPGAWGLDESGEVEQFGQWFRHVIGVNQPDIMPVPFNVYGDDGFGFADSGAQFMPLGPGDHSFTFQMDLMIRYRACAGASLAIESNGDVWIYVDNKLAIDHQQRRDITAQTADLDRFGLQDGEMYSLRIFYASRGVDSRFAFKVYNTELSQPDAPVNPAGLFD